MKTLLIVLVVGMLAIYFAARYKEEEEKVNQMLSEDAQYG